MVTTETKLYSPLVEAATRHARPRLLPFLMLMFVIAFIDRSNIGFAQEELEIHAGLSDSAYALGAGLFFIGYAVFEVPSNLIMHKVGAQWWMARIMVTWGIVAALFMFVSSPTWFYTLPFLLGVREAGFFPGVILYLTYWFPVRKRGQATGLFYMSLPIANMVGGPLSGGLLEIDGILGLFGFQWIFMTEGLLAIAVGVIAFFFLTDRPEQAKRLPDNQREALVAAIAAEEEGKHEKKKLSWWRALLNGRVLHFAFGIHDHSVRGLRPDFLPAQAGLTDRGADGRFRDQPARRHPVDHRPHRVDLHGQTGRPHRAVPDNFHRTTGRLRNRHRRIGPHWRSARDRNGVPVRCCARLRLSATTLLEHSDRLPQRGSWPVRAGGRAVSRRAAAGRDTVVRVHLSEGEYVEAELDSDRLSIANPTTIGPTARPTDNKKVG